MAISAEVVTVTDEPVALNTGSGGQRLILSAASADIALGADDVEVASGLVIGTSDAPLTVDLAPGEVLYAITATTATVRILRSGS